MTPQMLPINQTPGGPYTGQSMPYEGRLQLLGSQIVTTPGMIDSVAMEVWRYMSESEQSQRMDAKQAALYYQPMLFQELMQFENRHVNQFAALNDYHWQNMEYSLMSRQWSEEEKSVFEQQNLLPYVNNTMRPYVLTALGEKMGSRTDWRARAKHPNHDPYAQAANLGMAWAAKRNLWKMQEQYVYRDGLAGSRGVAGVRRDMRDPYGNIVMERYRPQEFMWDIMTARDPRLKGTKYLWRGYYRSRADLMVEFPEWAEEIRSYSAAGMYAQHLQNLDTLIKVKTDAPIGSALPSVVFDQHSYAGWYDSVFCREFFRRHPVRKYRVVDGYRGKVVDFDSIDQAQAWRDRTWAYWAALFEANNIPILQPAVSQVKPVYVDAIERLTWAGDILLRVEPFGQDEFPYHFFIPEWIDNNVTSFFGHGKDHQRIINRMFTRMDQAAGGVKGKSVINTWALQNEYSDEELDAILASDTAPLKVKVPPGMSLNDVFMITGTPSIGELPTMLTKIALDGQDRMFGGLNAIGQQQSAQESGKAVLARQSAASLAMIPYTEEFAVFKQQMGVHLLENIQQLDPVVLQTIIDDDPTSGSSYAKELLMFGEQSFAEIELELDLTEVAAAPSERERRLQTISYINASNPSLQPYTTKIFLRDADIDDDLKQEIIADMAADKQAAQQAAAAKQAHDQWIERQEMDLKHADRLIKLEELKIKAMPPPTWAVSVKAEDTPELQATLANRSGMPADALGVLQSKAGKAVLDQAKLDMQQQHYWDNTPDEIKRAEARKGVAGKQGVDTPKDTMSRANKNES